MTIYKLNASIDGYYNERPIYFQNFDDAYNYIISDIPGIYRFHGKLYMEGCKETHVEMSGDSLRAYAVVHTGKERNEWSIDYGFVSIEPINVGHISDNRIYELYRVPGYRSHMFSDILGEPELLEIEGSKNLIRKLARSRYKKFPRDWNTREFEPMCLAHTGGEDYLAITEYTIKGGTVK